MPLFFFISGYLFNDSRLTDAPLFFKKKLKGLYLPFVKWNVIFILLHNLFAYSHLYDVTYTHVDTIKRLLSAAFFLNSEEMLGGYWFLTDLFIANIVGFIILFITRKFCDLKSPTKDNQTLHLIIIGGTALLLTIGASIIEERVYLFKIRNILLHATAFFLIGYIARKIIPTISSSVAIALLILSLLFIYLFDEPVSIATYGYRTFILIVFASTCTLSIMSVSGKLSQYRLGRLLDFIGSNTLVILTFHFISFKLVSLYIIFRDNMPIERLADFPVIKTEYGFDWVLYSAIGIFLPLTGILLKKYVARILPFAKAGAA